MVELWSIEPLLEVLIYQKVDTQEKAKLMPDFPVAQSA